VAPSAAHAAVDEEDGREPALLTRDATAKVAGQQVAGVAGGANHVLIEGWLQADGTDGRKGAQVARVGP